MAHTGRLTLVQMNDSHAYLDAHPELFWSGAGAAYRPAGGYARIGTVLKGLRQANPGQVLAVDCGDTFHGTHAAVSTRGGALVPVLNALGFEAMTAHWDCAYGPQRLFELAGQLRYPTLSINCYRQDSDTLAFSPYTIVEAGGLRVGVIGIASNIVDRTMPPAYSEGLRSTLGRDELPAQVRAVREDERADLVVLMSHLGFPQDMKLAGEMEGIDVLLSGHTHNRLYQPAVVGRTLVIQSGCHGSFLGRLDLQVEGGRVVDWRHQLLTVGAEIAPDPEVQALVDSALAPSSEEMQQVVGHTATALNRNTVLEATMDNLLLQALREASGAGIAFSNGWRYGAPVPPGPVTLNDLWNIIPVNPPVSTCRLTGEELRAMMEENLERTFACDPYAQMGGYVKRCLGINVYFKIESPAGSRIQEIYALGEPLDPARAYEVAFVTAQGVPDKYGTDRQDLDVRAIDALRRYLARYSPARADLQGTVVAI